MKSIVKLSTMVALLVFSANSFAQETSSEAAKTCSKCPSQSTVSIAADDEKACCPVEAAMAKLPKMTYKVGEESTCCSDSAAALAKKSQSPILFVIGEKTFEDKEKAFVSLVEQTEAAVATFTTPSKCEASGTHSVAGTSCSCPVEAAKKAQIVKTATDKLTMTYVVGKESCGCAKTAAEMAAKTGEKMTYKVGETETCCSLTARLNLAHAKFKAAVTALTASEKPAQKAEAKSTEKSGT